MTCMCGDTECPSCGLAQGTLDERDLAVDFLRRHGYRRCDIPACNCGSWHGGHANARLNELREAFEQDEHTNTNGKTLLNLVCETLSERDALRAALIAVTKEPQGCRFCHAGRLITPNNPEKGHDAGCGFLLAARALLNKTTS